MKIPFALIASAIAAISLGGCVTEEVGPTNFHTTAYIERDTPEEAPTSASLPPAPIAPAPIAPAPIPDDPNASNGLSHH